jgi:hypothetical protein
MICQSYDWYGLHKAAVLSATDASPDTCMKIAASFVNFSTCSGLNGWYSYGVPESGSNCTVFNRDIRWILPQPNYTFTGRGYLTASTLVPDAHATATAKFFAVDSAGTDLPGSINGSVNGCAYSCANVTFYSGTINVSSLGGFRSNTQDDAPPGAGGCNLACGTFPAGYSQMHIQAAHWNYIDDWTCVGGYASSGVSDTARSMASGAVAGMTPVRPLVGAGTSTTALWP